jgi:hypothetical protein
MDSREALQERLLEAQMQLEEGSIDEATFATIERDVFARLRELRGPEASTGIADASAFDQVRSNFRRAIVRSYLYVYAVVGGRPTSRALSGLPTLPTDLPPTRGARRHSIAGRRRRAGRDL